MEQRWRFVLVRAPSTQSVIPLDEILGDRLELCACRAGGTPHWRGFLEEPDKLANELRKAPEYQPIPDYAYDCHTQEGRKRGKTKADFFKAEQAALSPFIPGLFDSLIDA